MHFRIYRYDPDSCVGWMERRRREIRRCNAIRATTSADYAFGCIRPTGAR